MRALNPRVATSGKFIAFADDLTGAAEIAGLGHRFGLTSEVLARGEPPGDAALSVIDTDSRLASPAEAARLVAEAAREVSGRPWTFVYKKTDSVLRGPVAAEVAALAAVLGRRRALLVPCNPSLGRTIRGGRYFLGELPLDETAFARDPHHPARTADVVDLLKWSALSAAHILWEGLCAPKSRGVNPLPHPSPPGESNALHLIDPAPPISALPLGTPLPAIGLIVGEATTSADVQAWAERVEADTLPAGGGEFFAALLRRNVATAPAPATDFSPAGPALLVTGTLASPLRRSDALVLPKAASVLAALAQHRIVAVAPPASRDSDAAAPALFRRALASLVRNAVDARAVQHIAIEGGATAAEILGTLGWRRLTVVHEWAQGVVTLVPSPNAGVVVTMKPGSYAWPAALRALLFGPHPPLALPGSVEDSRPV